jgi:hypothetical protein
MSEHPFKLCNMIYVIFILLGIASFHKIFYTEFPAFQSGDYY